MKEYRRRFGDHECRIEVRWQNGIFVGRLFTVEQDSSSPILDEYGHPKAIRAMFPEWVYLKAVRFLTVRFGPGD
jgi:hypothetical protein